MIRVLIVKNTESLEQALSGINSFLGFRRERSTLEHEAEIIGIVVSETLTLGLPTICDELDKTSNQLARINPTFAAREAMDTPSLFIWQNTSFSQLWSICTIVGLALPEVREDMHRVVLHQIELCQKLTALPPAVNCFLPVFVGTDTADRAKLETERLRCDFPTLLGADVYRYDVATGIIPVVFSI